MEKPFIVTSLGHRFRFIPERIGYSVSEIGIKGVNTQGDTFEEALANAHEASRVMAEFREELDAEAAIKNNSFLEPIHPQLAPRPSPPTPVPSP